ncbi:MarR family winged helix-turn-helix transcriptional regulator [Nocardia lijiangensis]|uniref:MarR family winged helix-turn-helix transcriptional regulator n=1 Tax=Nocardia lijiangensis TaxID=299618 RepID=UPI003D7410B1
MTERRIGYLLKELDRLIEARFDDDLAAGGLSRRHWQLLHTLSEGSRSADELREALAPFWKTQGEWTTEIRTLSSTGLITAEADALTLTVAGRAAHDDTFARIGERRRAMAQGVEPDQFATTLRVLERMIGNLADAS